MSQSTVIRSASVEFSAGLELLDVDDSFLEDISDSLLGGTVSHNNGATIHGTAKLRIARDLSWHRNRLRPYVTLTDQLTGESYRWDLGVYLPETPTRVVGESPQIFDVECYSKLIVLDTPYGTTYRVASGAGYVATVEAILDSLGLSHGLDQTKASEVLPSERIWELDETNTYLRILNDLLAAIGYTGLHVDRSGLIRSERWESPKTRSTVFSYSTTDDDSTVLVGGLEEFSDMFDIPNKWVFVMDDPSQAIPSEGAGIYTVINTADGNSSVNARGRTKTAIHYLDASSHALLVERGDRIVENDKTPLVSVSLRSTPNPLHWHSDVVKLTAPEVGQTGARFVETSWELPLDGSPMRHALRKVS